MLFDPTTLSGAWMVTPERREDERGYFARSYCEREFAEKGIATRFVQSNVSYNQLTGTLRGMHFQREPKPEAKLVRCTRGSAFDVIVDLRPDSPTDRCWFSCTLDESNGVALYIPPGFAHGFQTLQDNTELLYQMSEFYDPLLADGVRWNDPAFAIEWPLPNPILSERDRNHPDFAR